MGHPVRCLPRGDVRVSPNAPEALHGAFLEACTCYRAHAYTASAVMCRKTLEGLCAAHGVEERNLNASLMNK
ncbi:DUF4145 domain-containing protein [Burkholderia multivorans]|nr:DUF4145 domain-containing protein [Burkholderia multivorans]